MKLSLGFLSLVLISCASAPQETSRFEKPAPSVHSSVGPASEEANIDQEAIQRSLGLSREKESLGFQEKAFDTCQVGYGYSRSQNCEIQYFAVIHYRLQCRDSEGTISQILTADDLAPLADQDIKWNLPSRQGISRTDGLGYGQIKGIFRRSQRGQRLKLGSGGDFLYIRTGEINSIVTPRSWCR